ARDVENHSAAAVGKQRLEHVPLQVAGPAPPAVQDLRFRHRRMNDPRHGELAVAEEPVGMSGPLEVEILVEAPIEVGFEWVQIGPDHAIEDALHGRRAPLLLVEQVSPAPPEITGAAD